MFDIKYTIVNEINRLNDNIDQLIISRTHKKKQIENEEKNNTIKLLNSLLKHIATFTNLLLYDDSCHKNIEKITNEIKSLLQKPENLNIKSTSLSKNILQIFEIRKKDILSCQYFPYQESNKIIKITKLIINELQSYRHKKQKQDITIALLSALKKQTNYLEYLNNKADSKFKKKISNIKLFNESLVEGQQFHIKDHSPIKKIAKETIKVADKIKEIRKNRNRASSKHIKILKKIKKEIFAILGLTYQRSKKINNFPLKINVSILEPDYNILGLIIINKIRQFLDNPCGKNLINAIKEIKELSKIVEDNLSIKSNILNQSSCFFYSLKNQHPIVSLAEQTINIFATIENSYVNTNETTIAKIK